MDDRRIWSRLTWLSLVLALVAAGCSGGEDGTNDLADETEQSATQTEADTETEAAEETDAPATGDDEDADLVAAAQAEGTVVMYISSPLESTEAFLADFEDEYGIDVQVERVVGLAQYERFKQEEDAGQHLVDVIQISDKPAVDDLAANGYLAEYSSPEDERFAEGFYKIPGFAYVPWRTTVAVAYNTDNVSEEDAAKLTSWEGILDPAFADGKISMRATQVGAGYAPFLFWLSEGEEQYGEQFMRDLRAQDPVIYPDPVQAAQAVVSGEQDVWFTGWESFMVVQYEQGAPVRWVFPDPTPAYGNVFHGISANAQHPAAAELLMNWLTSEAGAASIQEKYKARSSMEGVEDNRAMTEEPWYQSPDEVIWTPDPDVWDDYQEPVNEAWVSIFGDLGAQ